MLKLWRLIKGYVFFKCSDGFVERFINLCASHNINIWDIKCSDKILTGYVSERQAKKLYELARIANTNLELSKTYGLPNFLSSNIKRKGLLIGLVLYFVITFAFSMFIWSVEIVGLETISEAYIREALSEVGLHQGVLKASINQGLKEQEVMSVLPDTAWVSLNIHGTVLSVEISEREKIPDIVPAQIPCNVKAKYCGQIVRIGTKSGTSECAVGDAVVQGQVLISGIIENKFGVLSICHADGTVIADTQHKINIELPMNYEISVPSKTCIEREMIDIMGVKSTIKPASSPVEQYYSVRKNEGLFVKDSRMPIVLTTEYLRTYNVRKVSLDENSAEKTANTLLELKKLFMLNDKKIKGCSVKGTTEKGVFKLTATYECEENICYKEELNITDDIQLFDKYTDTASD